MSDEERNESATTLPELGNADDIVIPKNDEKHKKKRKKILLKEAKKARNRGVCYMSRIPPQMDPMKLRQVLSQYGEIDRIYLVPETKQQLPQQVNRKKAGDFRGQGFSEGWVEYTNKRVAKRIAEMLNGEHMVGKKKSSFFYDIWNIKYLSKFKWDDLMDEIAYKHALREQKLTLAICVAKKERNSYMDKVDKSKGLNAIQERMKKKFERTMRAIQGALIIASTLQIVLAFSGLWRNVTRLVLGKACSGGDNANAKVRGTIEETGG